MRLIILATLALALAACSPSGPGEPMAVLSGTGEPAETPDPRLEGVWTAVLETGVEPRPLELTISLQDEAVSVILTAPGQGGARVRFEQVRLDGARVGFATGLGALLFEGELDGDDAISGTVWQGRTPSPLIWTRVE
ncbi:hypothetical protein F1654_06100 [Alkalicaulis satelles]|uniref:Lipocalin family protein n=1 Tax=Alkalicaulis satelles TaxID=2609175 RepID=A0A5M6ZF78_9PROT|nr:hypothetical protein [Alkalicaulis satelles]KAA5803379.1 hypothetical protein F1654_06100 [Alkalicaulis satelles]